MDEEQTLNFRETSEASVLLVEASGAIGPMLAFTLRTEGGFTVADYIGDTITVEGALEKFRQVRPRVVISNIPWGDDRTAGIRFLTQVRAKCECIITSTDPDNKQVAESLGFYFLMKSDVSGMIDLIKELLRNSPERGDNGETANRFNR